MKKLVVFGLFLVLIISASSLSAYDDQRVEKKIIVASAKKATLGVVIQDLENKNKQELKVDEGAVIKEVIAESEAERIGLKENDVIVTFDGKEIANAKVLKDLVTGLEEEKTVKVEIVRDGKKQTFTANLKPGEVKDIDVDVNFDDFDFQWKSDNNGDFTMKLPHAPGLKQFRAFGMPGSIKGAFLGVQAKNISKQMLEYFEVEFGVLVEEVIKDSPAEKAGLKAGDVITKIEDRDVKDFDDLIRIMNYYDPEEKVRLFYSRKGSKKSIDVVLGKKEGFKKIMKKKLSDIEGDDILIQEFGEGEGPHGFHILRKKLPKIKEKLEGLKKLENINIQLFII